MDDKKKAALLGLTFLVLLDFSYAENSFFFSVIGDVLQNQFLSVAMLFLHNTLVVSLVLIGMTFYVNLVYLNFFKREKYGDLVISHPRIFAMVFTCMIIFLSTLRGATLINGGVNLENLPLILLISAPVGIIEGYGIYLTIKKTLNRTITTKTLSYILGIFLLASIVEVGFINLLAMFAV